MQIVWTFRVFHTPRWIWTTRTVTGGDSYFALPTRCTFKKKYYTNKKILKTLHGQLKKCIFHNPGYSGSGNIENYGDKNQVRNCRLVNLIDLNQVCYSPLRCNRTSKTVTIISGRIYQTQSNVTNLQLFFVKIVRGELSTKCWIFKRKKFVLFMVPNVWSLWDSFFKMWPRII